MLRRISLALVIGVCVGIVSAQTTVTLRPTADGSVKQWTNNAATACTSATCYTEVNESTGSTNCTGSSFVKGSGVYNKSPATSARVEQYSLDLTSIPNNSIIQSVTVWTCQARGGSNTTSGTLRIVLNGATTTCAATQSATATYNPYSCVFGSLNVTKGSGTTLEIGNATTQARAIWMDATSAQVTYIQQAASAATAAFGTSDAVTGVKHALVQQVGDVTGAFGSAPACCATLTSPLGASFGISPAVEAHRATNTNACCIQESLATAPVCSTCVSKYFQTAAFSVSPSVTAVQGLGRSTTSAFQTSVAVGTHRGLHSSVAASITANPVTANVYHGFTNLQGETFATLPTVTASSSASGPKTAGVTVAFSMSTQVDEAALVSSGISQSFHFSPVVSGKVNLTKSQTAAVAFAATATALQRQPKGKFVVMVTH